MGTSYPIKQLQVSGVSKKLPHVVLPLKEITGDYLLSESDRKERKSTDFQLTPVPCSEMSVRTPVYFSVLFIGWDVGPI